MVDNTAVATPKAQVRGQVIDAERAEYDSSRRVNNGTFDRYPLLVAGWANVADVVACEDLAGNDVDTSARARLRAAAVRTRDASWDDRDLLINDPDGHELSFAVASSRQSDAGRCFQTRTIAPADPSVPHR